MVLAFLAKRDDPCLGQKYRLSETNYNINRSFIGWKSICSQIEFSDTYLRLLLASNKI